MPIVALTLTTFVTSGNYKVGAQGKHPTLAL